ncbi:hypothetical protein GDO81_026576 [Engystomops pustulosus]|uniref:Uncharacterized protein n=1 Tax=Engystomops pustulosus TaxID=76066 RepID=A0AAV6YJS1_ENGPU|nr:hypothetical protein GDO81_026576 [Engystomops pustulosus]
MFMYLFRNNLHLHKPVAGCDRRPVIHLTSSPPRVDLEVAQQLHCRWEESAVPCYKDVTIRSRAIMDLPIGPSRPAAPPRPCASAEYHQSNVIIAFMGSFYSTPYINRISASRSVHLLSDAAYSVPHASSHSGGQWDILWKILL